MRPRAGSLNISLPGLDPDVWLVRIPDPEPRPKKADSLIPTQGHSQSNRLSIHSTASGRVCPLTTKPLMCGSAQGEGPWPGRIVGLGSALRII